MQVVSNKEELLAYLGEEIINFLLLVYDAVRIVDPYNKTFGAIIDSVASSTDLDNFKNINDSFGHLAGDAVLKGFVQKTQQVLREGNDHLIRTGGDEFVLWMPSTSEEQAQAS